MCDQLRAFARWVAVVPLISVAWLPAAAGAQPTFSHVVAVRTDRAPAARLRLEVSLEDRVLLAIAGTDTLLTAPIAVASGRELRFGERSWRFETPRGRRTVKGKRADPVWRPPDWHYAEAALERGLELKPLPANGLVLSDGRRVRLHGDRVSVQLEGDRIWHPLPHDEHLIFESTLYIPPFGSRNRQVAGELGDFALDLGDGYLVHGTPDQGSVGSAVTHGCLRLFDEDIAWLFEHVPVGTSVVIR